MAYLGTTAASSVTNPLQKLVEGIGGNTPALWTYSSTHTSTDAATANFFTDAKNLGVQNNDILFGVFNSTTAPKSYMGAFGAVTTSGAALASAVSSTAA
jgi:hypothetical protein